LFKAPLLTDFKYNEYDSHQVYVKNDMICITSIYKSRVKARVCQIPA